ncbi:hypothetical protein B0I35DRAFT_507970 [Stachybotrys elegans]|uniref:Uncharacterized protein n=1 Tax=Stachybotrys elegans TaxID=80388 RepID=A0A8K0SX00_9HYPO|nr:hypothetical protein B0I35DRAFT_507970 [Stachybotrys elegans]
MRLSLSVLAFTAYISAATAEKCNANNCARAVTGTRLGPAVVATHQADCSSVMAVTVTPSTSTLYTTVTETTTVATETSFITTHFVKRTEVAEPAVPTYASACADLAAYSSACSCWGIKPWTVTAEVPSTTVTVTETVSTTAIELATATQTCAAGGEACTVSDYSNEAGWRAPCGGSPSCICDVLPGAGRNGHCTATCISPGNWCAGACRSGVCCKGYTGSSGSGYCDR